MTEYPPGPWTAEPNGPCFNLWAPDHSDRHHAILVGMTYNKPGELEAIAHLCAAAPKMKESNAELLAALKIIECLNSIRNDPPVIKMVRAAIAKAAEEDGDD